jgi:hypothetical protein
MELLHKEDAMYNTLSGSSNNASGVNQYIQ